MSNFYTQFKALFPDAPVLVGTVAATAGGVATILLPDGTYVQGRGSQTIGTVVFVRDGLIEGVAPTLTPMTILI